MPVDKLLNDFSKFQSYASFATFIFTNGKSFLYNTTGILISSVRAVDLSP